MYNDKKYIAVEIPYTEASYINGFYFDGWVKSTGELLKVIPYFDEETQEVLNDEVYNSLEYFTPTNYIRHEIKEMTINDNKVYHEGNSWPVVETGSNENGEYIRFADGTQICYDSLSFGVNNLSDTTIVTWTYPASFSEKPYVMASASPYRGDLGFMAVNSARPYDRTATACDIGARAIDSMSGSTQLADVMAIGRWK